MLSGPQWLALDVTYLDSALPFYRDTLGLPVRERGDREARLEAGDTDLVLRAPGPVPRGGAHTHFAFSTPREAYDDWWDRLSAEFDLAEHQFGTARSLYLFDPAGHCVEIGQRDAEGSGITGVFEVVLEVESLSRARAFYTDLGFEVVDTGGKRRRVRLTCGAFDLELWEPQLGLADGRGGVHVDLGVGAEAPGTVADRVADRALDRTETDRGVRLRDPDGHYVTLCG